jgi:mono/diheme cytochrome c family protein
MARLILSATLGAALAAFAPLSSPASADDAQIARGRYLVVISGCSDCHTPGALLGNPDMKRYLGGSDVGFSIPGQGIFVGQNLTPDKETGIGSWSSEQIVTAIRTGKTPEGRDLFPVMPWPALSHLTDEDAQAIAAFLKSIPAVDHKNAGPIGPNEKATVFVSVTMPADAYNAMQAAKK